MRSIWNGHVRFGLVTIPVGLAVARQRCQITFRTLHRACGSPIKQRRWCEPCGIEVETDADIARGFEFSKGLFAVVEPADRETLDTRRIEIARLLPAGQIPALMVDHPWWLTPAGDPVGRRPYRLLHDTLASEQLEALAAVHLYGHDHVCRLRPVDGALLLETLFAHTEIRNPAEIAAQAATAELSTHETGLARRLARHMARGKFSLGEIHDTRDRGLEQLIEATMTGAAIAAPDPEAAVTLQLADALRESIENARAVKASARRAR